MIKLMVGLGNPGADYADTRHNAGFWWVDRAAVQLGLSWQLDKSFYGLTARTTIKGQPLWLLKPQTFMNKSGQSVGALARFFKIIPSEILVIHDELDLSFGDIKLKQGGGHAGHNGLRDIHAALGESDYWRLKIGIGHPGHKAEVSNWVLKKPPTEQLDAIDIAIDRSLKALADLQQGQMTTATTHIHTSKPPRPKPERRVLVEGGGD